MPRFSSSRRPRCRASATPAASTSGCWTAPGAATCSRPPKVTQRFITALNKTPAIEGTFSGFDPNFPQYLIHLDTDLAAKKGVTVARAMSTLQTLMGANYASNFIRFGQMYKVMVQALPSARTQPEDVLKLYVKNDRGEMVPFATFLRLERVYGPEQLTRYNMYTSAQVNGDAAPGYSSGDAMKTIQAVAAKELPRGYSYEWSGMTREQIISGNQALYVFGVVLIFVYLLLAAQYESFLLPLPVLLSLPTGIFGAFLALKLLGLENNIYAQVALVMLVGLLGKNAILIIEFAVLRRKEGLSALDAAVEGARSRLRPILMTSFAFVAGLIPLVHRRRRGRHGQPLHRHGRGRRHVHRHHLRRGPDSGAVRAVCRGARRRRSGRTAFGGGSARGSPRVTSPPAPCRARPLSKKEGAPVHAPTCST